MFYTQELFLAELGRSIKGMIAHKASNQGLLGPF